MLTEGQIADGWIEHDGGPCPVEGTMRVRCLMKGEGEAAFSFIADQLDWSWEGWPSDIIAYRPEPPAP